MKTLPQLGDATSKMEKAAPRTTVAIAGTSCARQTLRCLQLAGVASTELVHDAGELFFFALTDGTKALGQRSWRRRDRD